jgi:hypothetical protein
VVCIASWAVGSGTGSRIGSDFGHEAIGEVGLPLRVAIDGAPQPARIVAEKERILAAHQDSASKNLLHCSSKDNWLIRRRPWILRSSTGLVKLLAQHSAEGLFEGLLGAANMLVQSLVYQTLVASSASLVNLGLEPRQDLVVESNSDAGLASPWRPYRTTLGLFEVVFFTHQPS